jgi:hypothetical protein
MYLLAEGVTPVEMPKTPDEILAACDNTATREEL